MTKKEKLAKQKAKKEKLSKEQAKKARLAKKYAKEVAKQEKAAKKKVKLEVKQAKYLEKKKKQESLNQKKALDKLDVIEKQITVNGAFHKMFKAIPDQLAITENTERFKRVLVARFFEENFQLFFLRYHKKGEPGFPNCDAVKVYNETLQQAGFYPVQGVVLHPSGQKKMLFDIDMQTDK
jgi:hypothetical protein